MITGIGTDITDINRIEKLLNDRFITRCFTKAEQKYCESKRSGGGHIAAYARRFAAKEATAKALGCGIGAKAGLLEIEITHDENGKPHLTLHGNAQKTLQSLGQAPTAHLSLSDEPPMALAFVIIETK